MKDWKDQAETLLRQIAGDDLAGQSVYLLDVTEAVEIDPVLNVGGFAGWTSPIADLFVAGWLKDHHRWTGRGFAAIISPGQIRDSRYLLGTVLHEFAHWLDFMVSAPNVAELDPIGKEHTFAQAALDIITDGILHPSDDKVPPWSNHGARFVRSCCHLAYRAGLEIEAIRPHHLTFGQRYYRSPIFSESTWMTALESELGSPGPIRNIIASEPPERFREFYAMATDWFDEGDPE